MTASGGPSEGVDFGLKRLDECGHCGEPAALRARRGQDGADLLDAGLEVFVDDDVIVLTPVVHLEPGVLQATLDYVAAVLGTTLEPRPEFPDRRRQDEN